MNKNVGGMPLPEGRRAIYQQAASWSADVHESLRASRRPPGHSRGQGKGVSLG